MSWCKTLLLQQCNSISIKLFLINDEQTDDMIVGNISYFSWNEWISRKIERFQWTLHVTYLQKSPMMQVLFPSAVPYVFTTLVCASHPFWSQIGSLFRHKIGTKYSEWGWKFARISPDLINIGMMHYHQYLNPLGHQSTFTFIAPIHNQRYLQKRYECWARLYREYASIKSEKQYIFK